MILLIFVLWAAMAITFPVGKLALEFCASPVQLIGLRMSLAGILILGYIALKRILTKKTLLPAKIPFSDLLIFIKVAIFHVYLAFVCEFWALEFLDSIKVNLLFSLTPLISAVLAFLLIGQRLEQKKWVGLILGGGGMLAIMATQNFGELGWKRFFIFSLPELVLMIGIISACYAWFLIRKLTSRGYSLLTINGIAFLLGGLACLIQFWLTKTGAQTFLPNAGGLKLFGLIGILILASNIVGYGLYGKLLHSYSNTFLSLTGFLCPIFGAIYSQIFSGLFPHYFCPEPITGLYIFGFVLILFGLLTFYSQEILSDRSGFL